MPNVKSHDAITFLLAPPIFAASWLTAGDIPISFAVAAAFLFGGLMFGPDLDTASRQYSRWGILRFLWFPYRSFFKHRSRWSHGLIFGAFLRVVYLFGTFTLAAFLSGCAYICIFGGGALDLHAVMRSWHALGEFVTANFGGTLVPALFCGVWFGAASHTLTDITVSYIKTGRTGELF
jgi:uncharacterized metal-binding protein